MICLDTSVLVEGLGAGGSLREAMQETIAGGKRLVVPSLVLYEWLCGPRLEAELRAQEALFPAAEAIPFGPEEARLAAELYWRVKRSRGGAYASGLRLSFPPPPECWAMVQRKRRGWAGEPLKRSMVWCGSGRKVN